MFKNLTQFATFALFYVIAINLIEYQGDWIMDFSGDVAGAVLLIVTGAVLLNDL